ncbi:B12-binding domain-containing radical SAM protein [Burkholderia ubonensis]|uniref:B12-binding domain-containing radical SAM protein n=1 Tax=Burkholderia ubonensis TaxID=101571 RepID=UPI00030D427D|nr:B12-binding domain-containing radical SAM protein [Burkholderia ubonensis]
MAYIVVCIATRWGSALGGINVFNTGLTQGIANILPQESQCICVVEKAPAEPPNSKITLLTPQFETKPVVDALISEIEKRPAKNIEGLLVIGHDLKTGKLAVDCANELQLRLARDTSVKSAVVSHMDYMEYARRKGQALPEVIKKSQKQHDIVASADHAFAVGPLLANGFQSARSRHNDRVIALTPGSSNIKTEPENRNSLRFYIGGRLGLEDDQIKNGVLSVQAVMAAYKDVNNGGQVGRWATRGHFYACGVDLEKDAELLARLKKEAREANAFEIEAIPFSNDQEELHQHLARSDVALMPSWHEGFGLSGWEALCAGVPLICSSQSGLALLIDQLRRGLSDADFQSIEPVQLAGGAPAGMPTAHDTAALSEAIKKVVANYPERKRAALKLAFRIKRHFTWERCAAELVAQINWPWANSSDWFQRQQVAQRAAESSDSASGAGVVLEALAACQAGNVEREWGQVCSALNLFSDVGSNTSIRERQTLTKDLLTIGAAISEALERKGDAEKLPIADTVFLDLCWRYMAGASRLARTFSDFMALFQTSMLTGIFGDSFLRREMLFYVCRFEQDFDGHSDDLARRFLEPLAQHLSADRSLRIRLARLAAVYPNVQRVIDSKGDSAFEAEGLRCKTALERPFDINQLLEQSPDIASTALALSSLKPDLARQSVDQPIGFFKRLDPKNSVTKTWRGDKRLAASMITVAVSSARVLTVLDAMAGDEEEAIRWAALDLAFSPVLRARLEAMEASSGPDRSIRSQLGMIVDRAVTFDGGHPWLAREFLNHYRVEHTTSSEDAKRIAKFTLTDFPQSRVLFGPPVKLGDSVLLRPMHPEVEDARTRASEIVKRVLLVLPPISFSQESGRAASTTSTPPLGLGLLATHLSQQGHDVQLVDCHRFPTFSDDVIARSKTFDLIGFNTVFSTVRSTRQMLNKIRDATQRPVLVIGGPAANLDGWKFSGSDDSDRGNWDFVISTDAVNNLQRLVDSLKTSKPWPLGNGLHPNPYSTIVAFRDVESTAQRVQNGVEESSKDVGWMRIQLDRRLYRGPDGQYEPGRTREVKGRVHEAHIVMSTGCDWNCSFCTERFNLSKGERRRDVDSVLHEVRLLAKMHPNLRIQFIDDNLFPQIASPVNSNRVRIEEGVVWAESFLTGLKQIRDELSGSLTWRGIFRLEDFAAYEAQGERGGFVRVLSEAGCNMLAFGVESGNADKRYSIKAGGREFTNGVIADLFRRLREAGIFTKAYFILGGPKETALSTEETISFAVNSGASLAYFALYKDFVRAQRELSKDRGRGDATTARLLDYEQLMSRWDEAFSVSIRRKPAVSDFGLSKPPQAAEYQSYKRLAAMGFRFEDLVKYNDYHAKDGPAGEVLKYVTWNRPDEFFALVEKAYRSFYLRPEFVAEFKQLVAAGY